MALFTGLQTPTPYDAEAGASRGAGNLGQGLLQMASMMQGQSNLEASKRDAAKQGALNEVTQRNADAKVGMVGLEIEQIRNNSKLAPEEQTLGVMDVFRRNGSLFNDPTTRNGISELAKQEALNEKMMEGFEKAKLSTIQKQAQEALLKDQIEMATSIVKSGPEGRKAAAWLFTPGEDGMAPVSDLANFNKVSDLNGKFAPPKTAQSTFGKLLEDRAAAVASGDKEKVGFYDAELASRGKNEGFQVQYDDQGRAIINYFKGGSSVGNPTVATQSRSQDKLMKYEAATELLNQLSKSIKPEFIGAQGSLGEVVFDRSLAQLAPEMANRERIDFRTGLVAARESLMREISNDTRFSNSDREEISKALPSSGVFESLPDAQQRMETVRRVLAQRGRTYSEGIGIAAPLWSLSAEDIKGQFEAKKITEQQAVDALMRFH